MGCPITTIFIADCILPRGGTFTKRQFTRININASQAEIVSLFKKQTSTGLVVGIRKEGVDLHLESCTDPVGQINCHIKHNGEMVWIQKARPRIFARNLTKAIDDSLYSWKNKDEVLAFKKNSFLDVNKQYDLSRETVNVDLLDLIKRCSSEFGESKLIPRKLGNMKRGEVIIGFPDDRKDRLVVAMPKHKGLFIPLDYNKGIIKAIPALNGAFRYVEIARDLGLMDDVDGLTESEVNEVKALMLQIGFKSGKK